MALKQIAFLATSLSSTLSTGTGINVPLSSYTLLNSNLSNGDTIYLVIERTSTTNREIILVSKTSNDNYNITSRGLYGTTQQSHESGVEVTCDDVPAYFEQLQDASAFPAGTSSVGIPSSKLKLEAGGSWTVAATGYNGTPTTSNSRYFQFGNFVAVYVEITGTSTGGVTTMTYSLPVAAKKSDFIMGSRVVDNGSGSTSPGITVLSAGSTTATTYTSANSAAWSGTSGTRTYIHSFWYEAN